MDDYRILMPRNHRRRKAKAKRIARERIDRLMYLARMEYESNPERSRRYVSLARKISMRQRVRIPRAMKRMICKACHNLLIPGTSARVRLVEGRVCVTCLSCGRVMRYRYK